MNKAIVIGSLNMDIVAFVKEQPKVGETVFGRDLKYFPGGKGSNQAVACRRLGCETLMIGRVGNDAFGEQLLAFQKQEGINTDNVRLLTDHSTGTALITVSNNSENAIVVIPGANAVWDDEFLDHLAVETGDVVLAQFEIPDEVILKTFKKAKHGGAATLLNPSPVRPILPDISTLTDLLVVNGIELASLSGVTIDVDDDESVFDAALQLKSRGYRTVIVTLGDKGIRLLQDGTTHRVAARTVSALDTTGAGDTFIGGLAAGILSGLNLLRAIELGNVAASLSVTRLGAASSIPTLKEVTEILNG
ncbi:ribokinase [Methylomonas sp. MgM2]